MAEVIWTPGAARDLDLIYDYISQFDPVAATRILNELIDAGDGLDVFPNRGRMGPRHHRELPSVPPFVIRYRVTGDTVFIVSVRHGA
jgi:toxin ParE1/3/4